MTVDGQLIRAEVVKLVHRRGLMALSALFSVGAIVLMFSVRALQHASDPAHNGPAGGAATFDNAIDFLFLIGGVLGAMVGATAGAAEIEEGIFRDLVATGRSRVALFGARLPGAAAVVVPLLVAGAGIAALVCATLHGHEPQPAAGHAALGALSVAVAGLVSCAFGVGLGAVLGSRGPVIGLVLAFWLPISQLLMQAHVLGSLRDGLPLAALGSLAGHDGYAVTMPTATAAAVLAGWVVVALVAGAQASRQREL